MGITEIILLVIGVVFFIISFFVGDKNEKTKPIDETKIRELIDKEMEGAKERIDDIVDETVNYSIEKTERALERLSNEKIMAVDQFSETVLKKINDNHQEVVFLYDMLNDKSEKIKELKPEINKETNNKNTNKELDSAIVKSKELKSESASTNNKDDMNKDILAAPSQKREVESKKEEKEESSFTPFIPEIITRKPITSENMVVKNDKVEKSATTAKSVTKNTKTPKVNVHFDRGLEGSINNNEQIRRMHEEGKSNMAIAKELGLGLGEVKLVIDLFSSKR